MRAEHKNIRHNDTEQKSAEQRPSEQKNGLRKSATAADYIAHEPPCWDARMQASLARINALAPLERTACLNQLSPRQIEVLSVRGAGLSRARTAKLLGLTPERVRQHERKILSKLQVALPSRLPSL